MTKNDIISTYFEHLAYLAHQHPERKGLTKNIENQTEAVELTVEHCLNDLGEKLSEIINQDGDEKTDAEVIDEIVEFLKEWELYKERV